MKEVLKLEKFQLDGMENTLAIQVSVLNKEALTSYIGRYGDKFYFCPQGSRAIGLNLLDILNNKDTTKITTKETYDLLLNVIEEFNKSFSDEIKNINDFKKLKTDEKLDTIYSLLINLIQED